MRRTTVAVVALAVLGACGTSAPARGTLVGGIAVQRGTPPAGLDDPSTWESPALFAYFHRAGTVIVRSTGGEQTRRLVTDGRRFRLSLAGGPYVVTADVAGARCVPSRVTVRPGHQTLTEVLCRSSVPAA